MKKMTGTEILALPMEENDSGADNIGGYLRELLLTLWQEGEGFSGKRPFGNSSWEWDLWRALVKGGAIKGKFDKPEPGEYPDLLEWDEVAGQKAIVRAIEAMAPAQTDPA